MARIVDAGFAVVWITLPRSSSRRPCASSVTVATFGAAGMPAKGAPTRLPICAWIARCISAAFCALASASLASSLAASTELLRSDVCASAVSDGWAAGVSAAALAAESQRLRRATLAGGSSLAAEGGTGGSADSGSAMSLRFV